MGVAYKWFPNAGCMLWMLPPSLCKNYSSKDAEVIEAEKTGDDGAGHCGEVAVLILGVLDVFREVLR